MKYEEAISWLLSKPISGVPSGHDRINYILDKLGKPHLQYSTVIIGGTNGKGSVTSMLESILKHTNFYVTGSTTSPHLVDIRERIRVQGELLSEEFWARAVTKVKEICDIMDKDGSFGNAGFFELVTAIAFYAFMEHDLDIAFVEVGLGGRLDATNVVYPELSVITNIGTDHIEILGPTKENIAKEKLGIARSKRPIITGEKDPSILQIFSETAKMLNSKLIVSDDKHAFQLIESNAFGHKIKLNENSKIFILPLPGKHQLKNLAIVLDVINVLRMNNFEITDEAVINGIENVKWPGRLQWFINRKPPVLLDGAHNNEGLDALIEFLREYPLPKPSVLILGCLNKKPYIRFAKELANYFDRLCFVPPLSTRALSKDEFINCVKPLDDRWLWFDSLVDALEYSKSSASVLITGSLYLIGEFLKNNSNI